MNKQELSAMVAKILQEMERHFPEPWTPERRGFRIGQRVYLEYGDKFDWPDLEARDGGERVFCYGLRDQIGVLCDGTVVPCCLDHEGDLALGNLLRQPMEDILAAPRAQAVCPLDCPQSMPRKSLATPITCGSPISTPT